MAMDFFQTSQKIKNQILKANQILVVSHQRPDADAFGSMIALGHWLESLGKNHHKLAYQAMPENLSWLIDYRPVFIDSLPENIEYDTLVILDSSDLARAKADQIISSLKNRPLIINIDHHHTNDYFGEINLVLPEASSTAEVIYKLLHALNFKINPQAANALLAGMLGDTYNFTNPNTKEPTLNMASSLLLSGASLKHTSESLLKIKSVDLLISWGKILKNIQYDKELNIAWTLILPEDIKPGITENEISDGIANFLNNLSGPKALMILQQNSDGTIKGSLRTNDELIDVSKLAKILGGGGHKKAAGFNLKGQLIQENNVWKII